MRVRAEGENLYGSVCFRDRSQRFLTALPLQREGARELILSHVVQTEKIFSGMTLLNGTSNSVLVSLEAFDRLGGKTAISLLELASGAKLTGLLPELLGKDINQEGGFVRVRSDGELFGFGLCGNNQLDFLSAIPLQALVR